MLERYITIQTDGKSEIAIKKSRFICSLQRVDSEAAAKEFIQQQKKEHWKATHNCSAFIIGGNQEIQRSSDDGEPSGTAGIPMLEVLKKQDVINVAAVVTRYFGGIKLGTGGLIRAYSHAVSHTLTEIGLVEGKLQQELHITIHYSRLASLQHFLKINNYSIKAITYGEQVTLLCPVDQSLTDKCILETTNFLNGHIRITKGTCAYHEVPLIEDTSH